MTADDQGIIPKPPVKGRKWIAVDLDGTLAFYDQWEGSDHIGEPILPMVELVKERLARGDIVCIFTSRVADPTKQDYAKAISLIHQWCEKHIGERLFVTATKFGYFSEFWDDRAVRFRQNKGVEDPCSRCRKWDAEEYHKRKETHV